MLRRSPPAPTQNSRRQPTAVRRPWFRLLRSLPKQQQPLVQASSSREAVIARAGKAEFEGYDSDDYEWEDEGLLLDEAVLGGVAGMAASSTGAAGNSNGTAHAQQQPHSPAPASEQRQQRRKQARRRATPMSESAQQQANWGLAGGGIVGLFVWCWMALIGLVLQVLRPVVSLVLMLAQPLTHMSPARAKHQLQKMAAELPEGFWAKLHWVWEQPVVKSIRITVSVANWGVRLPAITALLLTQGSMLASGMSLPMLAPLLLGTGMLLNSIKKNASFIIPRLGLLVVLLWILWFVNSVIQNTWLVLRNQGRIDARTMSGARMITECSSLLLAAIVVLSTLGININALLLPTGVVLAIASKDLLQNLIAGFYLVLVQPFRLGDKVAVSCTLPAQPTNTGSSKPDGLGLAGAAGAGSSSGSSTAVSAMQGWFEGVCEKVDLRYTVIRDGRRSLFVPNTAFVSQSFMVYDRQADAGVNSHSPPGSRSSSPWPSSSSSSRADHDARSTSGSHSQPSAMEPTIREGHMTTELPPLAQPIFPGMTFMAPAAYPPQYTPQHFTAMQYQPYHLQQQQQEEDEQGQGQQQQRQDEYSQHSSGAGNDDGAGGDGSSVTNDKQQQGVRGVKKPAAKGPPGYLPQGFSAGWNTSYVGIPVYYGLPGMLGPWGSSPTPAGNQQQRQQQQQQQQLYYEPSAMHQPVPAATPQNVQQPGTQQDPWMQQQWQQRQQHAQQPSPGTGKREDRDNGGNSGGSGGRSHQQPSTAAAAGPSMKNCGGSGSSNSEHSQQQHMHQSTAQGSMGFHQQAVHVAALGGYGYASWGGGIAAGGPLVPPLPPGHPMAQLYTAQPQHAVGPPPTAAAGPYMHSHVHYPPPVDAARGVQPRVQEPVQSAMAQQPLVNSGTSSGSGSGRGREGMAGSSMQMQVSHEEQVDLHDDQAADTDLTRSSIQPEPLLPAGGVEPMMQLPSLSLSGVASAAAVAGTAATHLQQHHDVFFADTAGASGVVQPIISMMDQLT